MKLFRWDSEKNAKLRSNVDRGGVGFEEMVAAIESGDLLDTIQNPSSMHPEQQMFVIGIGGYAYCVPFVEDEADIFLKTIFPSRRLTAIYFGGA
jgi:uncharacterized DUF497 family protein